MSTYRNTTQPPLQPPATATPQEGRYQQSTTHRGENKTKKHESFCKQRLRIFLWNKKRKTEKNNNQQQNKLKEKHNQPSMMSTYWNMTAAATASCKRGNTNNQLLTEEKTKQKSMSHL